MKKNKNKKQISKVNEYTIFSLNMQFFLTIADVVLFILYLLNKIKVSILEIVIGITLLVIGYNNYWVYRRKNYTLVYVIAGIIVIIIGILKICGVL